MGERWQAKYGKKRTQPTKSKTWLRKYGFQHGLLDFDPNQPRDDKGRWTSGAGGAGGIDPEHIVSIRVHGVPYYYRELSEKMADRPDDLKMIVDLENHHADLMKQYPRAKSLGVDIRPAPQGDPTGWVEAGEGINLKNELMINVNSHFASIQKLAERNYEDDLKVGGGKGPFVQFKANRVRPALEADGFDLDAFLAKYPDYKKVRGFVVPDVTRAKDVTSFLKNTITHEFAHVLHLGSGQEMYDRINPVAEQLYKSPRLKLISDYAGTNHLEAWAETFTFCRNYPEIAQDILPGEIIGFIKSLEG